MDQTCHLCAVCLWREKPEGKLESFLNKRVDRMSLTTATLCYLSLSRYVQKIFPSQCIGLNLARSYRSPCLLLQPWRASIVLVQLWEFPELWGYGKRPGSLLILAASAVHWFQDSVLPLEFR
jgi:hypothetical protein